MGDKSYPSDKELNIYSIPMKCSTTYWAGQTWRGLPVLSLLQWKTSLLWLLAEGIFARVSLSIGGHFLYLQCPIFSPLLDLNLPKGNNHRQLTAFEKVWLKGSTQYIIFIHQEFDLEIWGKSTRVSRRSINGKICQEKERIETELSHVNWWVLEWTTLAKK